MFRYKTIPNINRSTPHYMKKSLRCKSTYSTEVGKKTALDAIRVGRDVSYRRIKLQGVLDVLEDR